MKNTQLILIAGSRRITNGGGASGRFSGGLSGPGGVGSAGVGSEVFLMSYLISQFLFPYVTGMILGPLKW